MCYNIREVKKMQVDTKTMVSISEANQNFSKVAKLADKYGSVLILKNNVPSYILLEFREPEQEAEMISDKELLSSSEKIMIRNKHVYEELAK